MNKIAFLEATDWEKEILKKYPEFLRAVDLYPEALTLDNAEKFKDYEIISCFINSEFSASAIEKLLNLKMVATRSTGFDHLDANACKARKIIVSNVPSYGSHTVAEFTIGLMICLIRKIHHAYGRVRETGSFNLDGLRGKELFNKTLGVIGTGRIGTNVIKIANGLGMRILAHDKYPNDQIAQQLSFEYASLEKLLTDSDIITLHVPYNSETHHLLNKDNINLIKSGAYLINTSRGGIIETEALYQALKSGKIAGAALDVLEEENDIKEEQELLAQGKIAESEKLKTILLNHIFIDLDNVLVTPHNAFNTEEAIESILTITMENIESCLKGKPINVAV